MPFAPEIFSSAIVAVGQFNPAIFTPEWLVRHNLIGEGDAEIARSAVNGEKEFIISRQVAIFETGRFRLQVVENQFSLASTDALNPALKDLAVGIFQLLSHTPVTAVGLNFHGHYKLNEEDYFRIGDILAPKEIWSQLWPEKSIGLTNLTLQIIPEKRGEPRISKDAISVSVQVSNKVKNGIYLTYNDHHDVTAVTGIQSAEAVADIIDTQWEPEWHRAAHIFETLIEKALT